MKTIKGFRLDNYDVQIEQDNLHIDPLQLPVEIKRKALKDCKNDAALADAWLRGFAFCLEGQVEVKINLPEIKVEGDWIVRNKEPL